MGSATLDTTAQIAPIADGEATESWRLTVTENALGFYRDFDSYPAACEHFHRLFEEGAPGLHLKLSRQITTVETVAEATV